MREDNAKNGCIQFGNPDYMIGSCVDCVICEKELWEQCIKRKNELKKSTRKIK